MSKNLIESGEFKIYDQWYLIIKLSVIYKIYSLYPVIKTSKKVTRKILLAKSLEESLINSSAVVIITNWDEFLNLRENYHLTN